MKTSRPQIPVGAPEGTVWYGGPIDRCSVTLRIYGDDLIPEEITRLLNCPPTYCQTKGSPIYGQDGWVSRITKSGGWHLTVTSEEAGEWDVEQVVRGLLARLPTDSILWSALDERFRMDLFCGLFMGSSNRGFSLSADTCQQLAARCLVVGFDIYCPHEVFPSTCVAPDRSGD